MLTASSPSPKRPPSKHFGRILNGHIPNHYDHFHIDLGCSVMFRKNSWPGGPGTWTYKSPTYFHQQVCNDFNNAGISVDGWWGPQTQAAWEDLLVAFDMDCLSPETNVAHFKVFLDYVMMHAFKNQSAGYYKWGCGLIE